MGTLHGISQIAETLGIAYREAQHLANTNALPVFRIGRTVCSTRALLAEWLAANEAKARAALAAKAAV